ncbi:MAG: monofunctional biosynthetic peptidoglycan transglycosylase [Nitrospirae bacterium GWC2_42_7]|nr:MAG: monofunctional biosynthetic peptidoglycan transglycosylase [Nitrospirae bacterium GWC2_42_7]
MRKKKKSFLKRLIYLTLIALAGFIALQFIYPDISKLKKENPKKTAMMEYREEEWKEKGKKGGITQKWVPYSRISPFMTKAVLIGEDDKFWQHEGFDYTAMQKAIEKDIKAKKFKLGGSTISQQLAKNLFLTPSKNPVRKVREAIITWRMERALSKKRILEIYLNVAEWGEGIFGIEAASRHYYGIPASSLNAEQSARLSAVLPNPRRFNPLGEQKYVVRRADLIYSIMVKRGIVPPEFEEISEDKETVSPPESDYVPINETKSSQ